MTIAAEATFATLPRIHLMRSAQFSLFFLLIFCLSVLRLTRLKPAYLCKDHQHLGTKKPITMTCDRPLRSPAPDVSGQFGETKPDSISVNRFSTSFFNFLPKSGPKPASGVRKTHPSWTERVEKERVVFDPEFEEQKGFQRSF